ncbi:HD domain-containing protein [Croceitalea rosinachiae]|uniref:HD domain-containing protein n=1 Tax=Croceitalea rosinachiae TaxID=3075596 RepID=A0ABU3AB19_9FLAO|nr:HD domain-containing protein [Croceitalea sp. F388]MDT0607098.1 HD domain-containing protein [Croceitalea sp. F388]
MKKRWPSHLTYHSLSHTIDVANVCNDYITYYNIDKDNADLIRIAAISHDIGYLISPTDHEELGIKEVAPFLKKVLNDKQIESINGMIRATKVPQDPTTFYEEILADADLDYLGREDYDIHSEKLKQEFLYYKVIKNEEDWLKLQITFLQGHRYHTSLAKKIRQPKKIAKLEALKNKAKPNSNSIH